MEQRYTNLFALENFDINAEIEKTLFYKLFLISKWGIPTSRNSSLMME